tara:strand:- start:46 stop:462 length:417 start_codon:yes stop_codon:yes gene_type:complete
MYRFMVVLLLGFLMNGCFIVWDRDHHGSGDYTYYFDYAPYILDAGWECSEALGPRPDGWVFWARTDDDDGYEDLSYLFVRITSLIDGGDIKEVKGYDNINGYFSIERTYHDPECGDPVDIEFVIVDIDNNSESYILYW